jgi:hypothetical protein
MCLSDSAGQSELFVGSLLSGERRGDRPPSGEGTVAEQTQPWGDRTFEVKPQDPWAEPSGPPGAAGPHGRPDAGAVPAAPQVSPAPDAFAPNPFTPNPFTKGRATVNAAMPRTEAFTTAHDPAGWSGHDANSGHGEAEQSRPLAWHVQQLRRGGEWSFAAALFAFVCWGIWAISSDGTGLTTPLLVFTLSLLVAVGVFALARVLGRVVLEKQFGRIRRTARGAHMAAGVFMVGVGFAHLRQTQWVVDAWNWAAGLFA